MFGMVLRELENESYIANCLTLPHNEKEMVRKDPNDKYFNYNW